MCPGPDFQGFPADAPDARLRAHTGFRLMGRDTARPLADHLGSHGNLDSDDRRAVEA
jgi:hypothetical protein